MYTVQYVTQSCTTSPFDVVSGVPGFECSYATTRGTTGVLLETRGSKCAQDEFIGWETQVLGNMLLVTKTKELFDCSGVPFKGRIGPSPLDSMNDATTSVWGEGKWTVVDVKKGLGVRTKSRLGVVIV